jgi:phosphotransferase system  glucose/maltose/N-acetylglucosamine-specific IIC component
MGTDSYAASQLTGTAAPAVSRPSSGFLGAYQALTAQVTTQTYANGFFVVAILGLAGAALAIFMRSGLKQAGGPRGAVEM